MKQSQPTSIRLSEQARANLEFIQQQTGANQTAAVEMALGLLAAQLTKGETMTTKNARLELAPADAGGYTLEYSVIYRGRVLRTARFEQGNRHAADAALRELEAWAAKNGYSLVVKN